MSDFTSMGAWATMMLLTINIGLLAIQCTAGAALLPDFTYNPLNESEQGANKLSALIPSSFKVCQYDASGNIIQGGTSDYNAFDTNGLTAVSLTDENVSIGTSTDPLPSFLGLFGMLSSSLLSAIKLGSWMLFGYVFTLMMIPMPAEFALLIMLLTTPIVMLQILFILSLIGSVIEVIT